MINFYISGQKIRYYTPVIAADTLNYLTAHFSFTGNDWEEYTKWAHFRHGDTTYDIELNEDNEIDESDALNLTAGEWEIYLTGSADGARLTTIPVILTVKESGLVDAPLHVMPQTAAEQIDAKASQALLLAQSVKDRADAGEFNGADGHSFSLIGFFESAEELESTVHEPGIGEAYGVGETAPYDIYIWDSLNEAWVNNGAIQGIAGETGPAGAIFIPSVDAGGNLSWTNNGGLGNPETVNISGPTGATGATGADGASAYDKAAEAGYTGTEATFYAALTAMPYHNARHLPNGADPILVKTDNIEDAAVSRAKLAANAVSNMYTTTLDTAWSGSEAPYSKVQTVSGILSSDYPVVDLVPSSTYETAKQQEDEWANIYRIEASANTLTFYAHRKPTVSLPIKVQCIRK